jgi:hypothetical protein
MPVCAEEILDRAPGAHRRRVPREERRDIDVPIQHGLAFFGLSQFRHSGSAQRPSGRSAVNRRQIDTPITEDSA